MAGHFNQGSVLATLGGSGGVDNKKNWHAEFDVGAQNDHGKINAYGRASGGPGRSKDLEVGMQIGG